MVRIKGSICPHCASTGSMWDGSEYVECMYCDGQDRSEQFDSIIEMDDFDDYGRDPFVDFDNIEEDF